MITISGAVSIGGRRLFPLQPRRLFGGWRAFEEIRYNMYMQVQCVQCIYMYMQVQCVQCIYMHVPMKECYMNIMYMMYVYTTACMNVHMFLVLHIHVYESQILPFHIPPEFFEVPPHPQSFVCVYRIVCYLSDIKI